LVEAKDDGLAQAVHGECDALESIGGDLAQDGFEFGKELFDGVEVWTIGWNVEQLTELLRAVRLPTNEVPSGKWLEFGVAHSPVA
jgi:hypothetical protein